MGKLWRCEWRTFLLIEGLGLIVLKTNESKKYSANVRRMTMIDAMGNNIRNPPETCTSSTVLSKFETEY